MNCLFIGKMDQSDFWICKSLAQTGSNVYFSFEQQNENIARKLTGEEQIGGKLSGTLVNFKQKETIVRMIEEFKARKIQLDILLTSFHTFLSCSMEDVDMQDMISITNENVSALYYSVKNCIPLLMESKGMYGNIMDSCAFHYVPNTTAYAMTQAAGIGFVKSLAKEYERYGVRALNIVTNIESGKKLEEGQERREETTADWQKLSVQVAELLSNNEMLTGQSIFLDQFASDYLFC